MASRGRARRVDRAGTRLLSSGESPVSGQPNRCELRLDVYARVGIELVELSSGAARGMHQAGAVTLAPPQPAPPAAGAPPVAPRPRRALSPRARLVIAIGVIALITTNAFVVRDLLITGATTERLTAEEAQTRATIDARQADVAVLRERIDTAIADLTAVTRSRDAMQRSGTSTRAAAVRAARDARAALVQTWEARGRTGSLTECLIHLQGALNAVSIGDAAKGSRQLADLKTACDAR